MHEPFGGYEKRKKIRQAFMERTVPVGIGEWQRFCYQSNPGRKWRWTWHFRFFHLPSRVSLLTWAQALFFHHPPPYVVDFTGVVVGDRKNGVCRFCKKEKRGNP